MSLPAAAIVDDPISLIRTTPPTPNWLGTELARALGEIASRNDLSTLLRYHRFAGTMEDREAGACWLSKRFGTAPEPDRIIVTNGTQSALMMALSAVVGIGGLLLVESVSYYGVRRIAEFLGVRVEAIDMDEDGALPDAFEAACKERKPSALFLTPTLHNPTTYIMSEDRRLALAAIARRYGVAIVEDDVYGLLPDEAPLPIAALAPDVTWYATSLAKCVAPTLKTGYLVAPTADAAASALKKFSVTSLVHVAGLSAALAQNWIFDGTADKILDAVRQEASARQRLAVHLLAGATFVTKPESFHLWLKLPPHWTQAEFVKAADNLGVIVRPGSFFSVDEDQAPNAIRLVVGSPETRDSLARALAAIASLLQ